MPRHGESYTKILSYWAPEVISAAVLTILPQLFDAYFISQLQSTSTYGALGVANNLLHMLIKLSEAFSVATMTLVGHYNGAQQHEEAGKTLGEAFWTTFIVGLIPSIFLFMFPQTVYGWLGAPASVAVKGAPFLRLRAIGVLLSFSYLAFFGFMRGIKNTKTPMNIFTTGILTFMLFDYALVLGNFGFPKLGLTGSAIATIVQYGLMLTLCIWHVLSNKQYRDYFPKAFFYFFSTTGAWNILTLSFPIMVDKVSLSFSYVHLNKLLNPMGKYVIAAFTAIKDLERFAFLPAIAFAVVVTFLVSNSLGGGDLAGMKANVRRVFVMSGAMVFVALLVICLNPEFFVSIFDPRKKFSSLAGSVFPFISVLVVFDFVQLILAGVLRGARDVKTVMLVRFFCCFGFFYPFAYFLSTLPIQNPAVKLALIYGSFYINTMLIGLCFVIRIKRKNWDKALNTPKDS